MINSSKKTVKFIVVLILIIFIIGMGLAYKEYQIALKCFRYSTSSLYGNISGNSEDAVILSNKILSQGYTEQCDREFFYALTAQIISDLGTLNEYHILKKGKKYDFPLEKVSWVAMIFINDKEEKLSASEEKNLKLAIEYFQYFQDVHTEFDIEVYEKNPDRFWMVTLERIHEFILQNQPDL